jgi:hypothetical protein
MFQGHELVCLARYDREMPLGNLWGKEKRGKEAGEVEWRSHSLGLSAGVAMVGGWHLHHPQAVVSAMVALVARQRPPHHVHHHCLRHIV